VLNGMLIGFITSSITSVNIVEETSLYNTLTGSLNNSYEYRYSIMRNVQIPGSVFTDIDTLLDALKDGEVEAALIDIFSMVSYQQILKAKRLKVVRLIDAHTGYGFVLSGAAQVLKDDFESLVFDKQGFISEYVATLEDKIPDMDKEGGGSESLDVFSSSSPAFTNAAIYISGMILIATIAGITYQKVKEWRAARKIVPISHHADLLTFSDDFERFHDNLCYIAHTMTIKHENETLRLLNLRGAYESKIRSIGRTSADEIIKKAMNFRMGTSHT